MKLTPLFCIALLFCSFSVKSQNEKERIESLNTSLVSYSSVIAGENAFYQIRTEQFGKKIVLDLYYGKESISKTAFYRNQIDRLELSIAPAGNPVINIFVKDGQMSYVSIPENKEMSVSQQSIPLNTSEEEAKKIKDLLEDLFKVNTNEIKPKN